MLLQAELCEGTAIEASIERLFAQPQAFYIHAFYAKFGCYAASIQRS